MGEVVRKKIVVTGRVQGVFFRDTCRRMATSEGVSGSVVNRPDGALEAHFEGDPSSVDKLVAWCRQGPPMAHVDSVDVEDEEPTGEQGFSVR